MKCFLGPVLKKTNKQTNTPFAFSTDAQLVTRAEHMSEQLDIRALEQSLLSSQQRQETFSPLCLRGLYSHGFVEERAADRRGNATMLLLSVMFLHGSVSTVTHINRHNENYHSSTNCDTASFSKTGTTNSAVPQ